MSYKTVNEYLSKISKEDMIILKQILEHGNGEPETFEGTLLKGVQHNQKIIDERVNNKK